MHKLEQILRKGKDVSLAGGHDNVVQHKSKPPDSEDLSIQGLKGKTSNGNRGYADVLLFKRDCLPYLLDSLPRELGLDPVWFTSVARPKMDSVVAHMDAARNLSWFVGIDRKTMTYVNPRIYLRSHIRQLHQGPRQKQQAGKYPFPTAWHH